MAPASSSWRIDTDVEIVSGEYRNTTADIVVIELIKKAPPGAFWDKRGDKAVKLVTKTTLSGAFTYGLRIRRKRCQVHVL